MRLLLFILLTHLPLATISRGDVTADYEALIKGLADNDFTTRTNTQKKLVQFASQHPEPSSRLLYHSAKQHPDPEVRQRCYTALRQLYKDKFAPPKRGYLGIRHNPTEVMLDGNMVNAIKIQLVMKDSAAQAAGLMVGDDIIAVDDKRFTKIPTEKIADAFSTTIKSNHAGAVIEITYLRNGKQFKTKATLGVLEMRFGGAELEIETEFQDWLKTLKKP